MPPALRQGALTRNVVVLGVASLCNDAASELVVPLLPVFVHGLGGGAIALGWMEGAANLIASLLKLWSGRASDRAGRSLPFVLTGYALAGLTRPLLALATLPAHVVLLRSVDRVGKGLRTAPRDALLASSVDDAHRGEAFGFHRAMDHAGAMLGPAAAFLLLTFVTTDLRTLFLWATVPSVLAVLSLFALREPARAPVAPPRFRPELAQVVVLLPFVVGAVGEVADVFLLLKAGVSANTPLQGLPVLWVALHLVRSGVSVPAGWLADRVGPAGLVALGYLARAVVAVGLAVVTSPWATAAAVTLWGLAAISEGAEKKLVSQRIGATGQGSAFGLYHLLVGVAGMAGALAFGTVWDHFGDAAAFSAAAVVSAVAAAWVGLLVRAR